METICLITEDGSGLSNYICANNWKSSKRLICLKTPINTKIIDKYFTDDEEIDTIKEAMIETPLIFEFNYNFKPGSISQFHDVYLFNRTQKQLKEEGAKTYLVIGESIEGNFWVPSKDLKEGNFLLDSVARALITSYNKQLKFVLDCNVLIGDELVDLCDGEKVFSFKDLVQFKEAAGVLCIRLRELIESYDVSNSSDVEFVLLVTIKSASTEPFNFIVLPFAPEYSVEYKESCISDIMASFKQLAKSNLYLTTSSSNRYKKRLNAKGLEKITEPVSGNRAFNELLDRFISLPTDIAIINYLRSQDPYVTLTTSLLQEIEKLNNSLNNPEISAERNENHNFDTFCPRETDFAVDGTDTLFKKVNYRSEVGHNETNKPLANTRNRFNGERLSLSNDKMKGLFKSSSNVDIQDLRFDLKPDIPTKVKRPREVQSEVYRPLAMNNLAINDDSLLNLGTLEISPKPQAQSVYKLFKEKMGRNEDILDIKFKELQRENIFLKKSFERQNTNFLKLQSEIKKKNDKINFLSENIKELQKGLDLVKEAKMNAITEKKLAEANLNQLNDKLAEFENKLKEKRKKSKKLKKMLKETSNVNSSELDRLVLENRTLVEKLNEIKDSMNVQSRIAEDYEKQFNVLKDEMIEKDKHLIEAAYEMQNKENMIRSLEAQLGEKNNELSTIRTASKITEKLLEDIKLKQVSDLEASRSDLQTVNDRYDKKVSSLTEKLVFYERKVEDLSSNNTNQSWELREKNKEISDLQTKAVKYENLKLELKRLEHENVNLGKLMDEKGRIIEENAKMFDKYENDFSDLRADLVNLTTENFMLKELNKNQNDDLANREKQKQLLNEEIKSKLVQISSLEKDLIFKQKEKEEVIGAFEKKLEEVVREITDLQNENEKLINNELLAQKQVAHLNDFITKLKEKNKDRKTIIIQLNNRLEKMREELRDKNYAVQQMQYNLESNQAQRNIHDKKINMVSDIKNMISCYKNLSSSK